jgi:hypothetical protein
LPRGRLHARRKGEALAPAIESREQLIERLQQIGAYNFGAQYQQAPFHNMEPDEMRGGCFAGPVGEDGVESLWYGRVSEVAIMLHELFGIGDRHPAQRPRKWTVEEFEQYLRWTEEYQRKSKEEYEAEHGPMLGTRA